MIGHFVGAGVQFIVEKTCKVVLNKVTLNRVSVCPIVGIFAHEFIAEPLVNSLLINGNYEHNDFDIKQLTAGAVGAVTFSQATEYFIGDDHIIISSIASLAGSFAGGNIYDVFAH